MITQSDAQALFHARAAFSALETQRLTDQLARQLYRAAKTTFATERKR